MSTEDKKDPDPEIKVSDIQIHDDHDLLNQKGERLKLVEKQKAKESTSQKKGNDSGESL